MKRNQSNLTTDKKLKNVSLSDLKILHSKKGFYIGRTLLNGKPYNRESGYYVDYVSAEIDLHNNEYKMSNKSCIAHTQIFILQ